MHKVIITATVIFFAGSTLLAAEHETDTAAAASVHQAHQQYVAAINSNDIDSIMAMVTEDIVFMPPDAPVIVGKAALTPWVEGYLRAFKTHWEEPLQEVVVCGDWAFERHSYKSTDTSLVDGSVLEDTGWGLVIYHLDADGIWRVARDAWGHDHSGAE